MAGDTAISVGGVSKSFRVEVVSGKRGVPGLGPARQTERRVALRDVSFDVSRGRTVGVIGPNGAGKSTLLKVVTGILKPDAGTVRVRGTTTPIIGLQAGFSPKLSGLENIYLKGAALGMTDREVDARLDEIREFSGIGHALGRPFHTYSSGMRMRLAFSMAFLDIPEVLIVDETLAVGDEVFRRKSMARIEEIKEAGATILFVSHGAELMRGFCDRILLLDEGELLMDADPDQTLDAYQRLVYAAPHERADIRSEIGENGRGRIPAADGSPAEPATEARPAPREERWDEDSRPLGGQITGCRFLGPDGAETRQVESSGVLTAEVTARFGKPARDVSVRLALTTPDGFELGALRLHPAPGGARFVTAGESVRFTAELCFPLAAGAYHAGAELLGYVGDQLHRLHRRGRLKEIHVVGGDPRVDGPVRLMAGT